MRQAIPRGLDVEYTTEWPEPMDGQTLTPDALRGFGLFPWQIESENPLWRRPLKAGEIGCAIAHWSCWRRSLRADADLFAYFEDDVHFVEGFLTRLDDGLRRLGAHDADWDLLYLGRYGREPEEQTLA